MEGFEVVVGVLESARITGRLWIDGSFLTEKIDPDDIDLVLSLDGLALKTPTLSQRRVLNWWSGDLKSRHRCDTYVFFEFPYGDPNYSFGRKWWKYWYDLFGSSRSGVPKGIAFVDVPRTSRESHSAKW